MKKILVIEDNLENRENTAELLQLAQYEVYTAEDGTRGIYMALLHRPDLILCDVCMPGLSGYELLDFLHNNEALKGIPFIFLTALADHNDLKKGFDLGANAYIIKPFTEDELMEAIEKRLLQSSINK